MIVKELPKDRLATTDEQGRRIYLYPSEVRGRFRNWRTRIQYVLILFFLALPWIQVGGHQAVLLDIAKRRFAIFGLTFWAHDAPMLVFILGAAVLSLAFVTAVWGRVWCGWACPQTVFIDGVFRRIEKLVEGDAVSRRRLDTQPMSMDKFLRKFVKWSAFAAVAMIITHSFLAYFVGTETLSQMVRRPPSEHPGTFLFMASATAIILFDFGWFREQFCTIVCPYGRFQSVLMDDKSLVVAYDTGRGEPRKGHAAPGSQQGDCVNCYRCVQVCPTGIDIRRGTQMECIACTACIDACDDVMTRLNKPAGLIRYDSESRMRENRKAGLQPRVLAYLVLIALFTGGLIFKLATRAPIETTFIRAVDTPYQQITSESGQALVVNHYKANVSNTTFESVDIRFEAEASAPEGTRLVTALSPLPVEGGTQRNADLFIQFPRSMLRNGRAVLRVRVLPMDDVQELILVGPYGNDTQ